MARLVLLLCALVVVATCRPNWKFDTIIESSQLFPLVHDETVEDRLLKVWHRVGATNITIHYLYHTSLDYKCTTTSKMFNVFRDVILVDETMTFSIVREPDDKFVESKDYVLVDDETLQDELIQLRQQLIDQTQFDYYVEIAFVSVAIAIPSILGFAFASWIFMIIVKSVVTKLLSKSSDISEDDERYI